MNRATVRRITTRGAAVSQAWRDQAEFTTHGALRGAWFNYVPETGQLPDAHVRMLRAAMARYGALFIVHSYSTPIAWRCGEYWVKPSVRYSVTTSKHQGRIY